MDLVKEVRNMSDEVLSNLESFSQIVQEWNKLVFGNIFARKEQAIWELKRIQGALERKSTKRLKD